MCMYIIRHHGNLMLDRSRLDFRTLLYTLEKLDWRFTKGRKVSECQEMTKCNPNETHSTSSIVYWLYDYYLKHCLKWTLTVNIWFEERSKALYVYSHYKMKTALGPCLQIHIFSGWSTDRLNLSKGGEEEKGRNKMVVLLKFLTITFYKLCRDIVCFLFLLLCNLKITRIK